MASPTLTIRRSFSRPTKEEVASLQDVPTGWAADALGGRGGLDHGIRAVFGTPRVAGPALTVQSVARDNLAVLAALAYARPGDILVVATGNYLRGSTAGDIVVGMAKNAGIAAVVTDGMVRDINGLREVGLPVFARGLSPNAPKRVGPGSVGVPISVGGEPIAPGDIILADEDGVVVVAQSQVQRVLAALEGIRAREASMEAALRSGLKAPDWLAGALADEGICFVD